MRDGERLNHPILEQSFAIIDQEIGNHSLNSWEYAIARRVIHTTADFEFAELLRFSPDAIESGMACLRRKVPIITDVGMVKQGITTMVAKTFNNFLMAAVEQVLVADAGRTRTEIGILRCFEQYPQGIYVIGNAPTALLALCDRISESNLKPGLIIGAPVGFVSVVESKQALARLSVPQIRVEGRKGGSPVAAAILNALLVLAWENL
ncbi:MAG: cobalt-precorrin-8X methylmutase [Hydrococcus sp. C42_A2020_068]|uniref:cobalt-precorrin-8X methylmutase n=1 Tax=Pleurocapsa sp. PCC 7327 TaxID=118163 RepID=UPI00029F8FA5|nr:cobalt-precorrin-8X methylmutase [Pleurocapsa sp. PCC 7327]AFY76528.1 precorrin isomerase [Pleurocapsa sp. PCC 7327]MBF2022603.1 cobalt-precorrin-8X methylmutase [Hydrococcus sp. C42_A2020_068]